MVAKFAVDRRRLIIVLVFALAGFGWWLWQRNNTEPTVPQAPGFIEPHEAIPEEEVSVQSLDAVLSAWAAVQPGEFAVSVREISGGERSGNYRPDELMVPASTYKLFLVYAILHEIEAGRFDIHAEVSPGLSIRQCINDLIVQSSDACAWQLGNLIGWDEIDRFLAAQGYTQTKINNYSPSGGFTGDKVSSARDQVELVLRLERGELFGDDLQDYLLSLMRQQVFKERIPAGVPLDVIVADKPGFIVADGIQTDTGVVYAPSGAYAISILSVGTEPAQLADLSEVVYQYMTEGS